MRNERQLLTSLTAAFLLSTSTVRAQDVIHEV